jgi:outer membrane protein assembly factor BamB
MILKRACVRALLVLACPLALAPAQQEDYLPFEPLDQAGLAKSWQLALPLEADQQLTSVYLVDDQLYLATNDSYVFAVHADTGAVRWLRRISSEGYRVWRPCHAGERVIFSTPTTILQLDRITGEGIDQTRLDFAGGSSPVSDGSRMFIGGVNQRMYAFDVTNPLHKWQVRTDGPITAAPVVRGDRVFFACDNGSVYSCAAYDKSSPRQNRTFGAVNADLVANAEGIYVASLDHALYLFDPLFLQLRWRTRFSGPLHEPPVLLGDTAYQYSPHDGLAAVNTDALEIEQRFRWILPQGRRALAIDPEYVFVLSRDEMVLVVRRDDGTVVHTVPAGGFVLADAATESTVLYLASRDGRVFCARPLGTPVVPADEVRYALTPPEAAPAAAPADSTVAIVPPAGEQLPPLQTAQPGPPVGGRSKVSQGFDQGGGGAGTPAPRR